MSKVSLRFDRMNRVYSEMGVLYFSVLKTSMVVWYEYRLNSVRMLLSLYRGLLFSLAKNSTPNFWYPSGRHLAQVLNFSRYPFLDKVVPLVKIHILGPIPAFYDLHRQRYTFTQLALNYPIISIISKTKGQTKKVPPTKLLSSSK